MGTQGLNRVGLTVSSAPSVEPVSLQDLKNHLRIDDGGEDAMLTIYGKAARMSAERYQNRALITQTLQYTMEQFPSVEFILPRPPLQSITSITYLDTAGDSQTWAAANYQVDTNSEPGRVKAVSTASYPSTQSDTYNAVTVTYVAGYGAAASTVPENTRNAILLWAAQMYEFREPIISGTIIAEVPNHIKALLDAEWVPYP